MSTGPVVSVILPTYNRVGTLSRAILSVLSQTFRDLELIVVDDGSTDGTEQLVAGIDDPRLRYLHTAGRQGAASARNIGARAARGPWLAFQDSDDEWTSGKLDAQLEAAAAVPTAPLVCCWFLLLRPASHQPPQIFGDQAWPDGDWSADACFRFPFITPTWLLRRESFETCGGFDENLPNLEDWELAFRLIRAGTRVVVIEEPLVVKHTVGDGLFRDMPARLAAYEAIYERHHALWASDPKVAAKFLSEIGRLHCLTGNFARGRSALAQSMRKTASGKAALHWLASCAGARAYRNSRGLFKSLRHGHARAAR